LVTVVILVRNRTGIWQRRDFRYAEISNTNQMDLLRRFQVRPPDIPIKNNLPIARLSIAIAPLNLVRVGYVLVSIYHDVGVRIPPNQRSVLKSMWS